LFFLLLLFKFLHVNRDLSEDLITDNAIHTDLEPLEAPEWSVAVALHDRPDCLLAKHLDAFLLLCADTRTVKQLLGDLADGGLDDDDPAADGRRVLDRLAGHPAPTTLLPSVSLSDLASKVRPLHRSRTPTGGPLRRELLQTVLAYLFPDAGDGGGGGSPVLPYPPELSSSVLLSHGNNSGGTGTTAEGSAGSISSQQPPLLYPMGTAKTGPPDGLVARLAKAMACCLAWGGGAAGVAHLLHEVVLEVRYRWEAGHPLPGLGPAAAAPDTAQALLTQKLQMLNCCIGRRNAAISRATTAAAAEQNSSHTEEIRLEDNDSDTDYEEEFFDAEDGNNEEEAAEKCGRRPGGSGLAAWETAEGRADRVGQLRLLSDADWLYRPVLQEPAPLTEDQLAEQVGGGGGGFFVC
jgi:Rab3 GTPase-activating protein catalytic subunit